MGTEAFAAKVQPSSQLSYPTHVPLDADKAETEDSQVTTAAISPDEIYCFVFAQVDEEMGADPSHLVAVMIEYLRWYAFVITLISYFLFSLCNGRNSPPSPPKLSL